MSDSTEVLLERVDGNVKHLRDEFDRLREELPTLAKRVESLENHRSWLAGVVAVLGVLVGRKEIMALLGGFVFLLGCIQAPPVQTGPSVMETRPVRVIVDERLPECEQAAIGAAVTFWRNYGIEINLELWDPEAPGHIGDVLFVDDEIEEENVLGLTMAIEAVIEPGHAEIVAAVVVLDSCLAQTATHELGHALGLPHREERGALMFPSIQGGGWDVSELELSWIR